MSAPWLLDAFCGVGGATKGYQRAGFRVLGVDIDSQPDYCGDDFVQGDAVSFIRGCGSWFAAIHASPPCQAACTLTKGTNIGREYPQLIPATRDALKSTGKPWVIENVPGAPLRRDLTLCGDMFPGLAVIRHRYFELFDVEVPQPAHTKHRGRVSGMRHGVWYVGPYVQAYGKGGGKPALPALQSGMGIDWTASRHSITEAIPPAYSEYIGKFLLEGVS
jgi:DNA (cytosine-5)-methyltransferase 1